MDTRPLKVKALECAIRELMLCKNREQANAVYLKWSVFKTEPKFTEAIKYLKEDFDKLNIN